MKVRIKIPKRVKEYYDTYGTLTYCINRLLDEFGEDWIDTPIAASSPNEDTCTTTVDITSVYYEPYRDSFGALSKRVSPSRLLVYAYEIDHCSHWHKKSELTTLLYKIQKLSKDDLLEFIRIIKETYL